MFSNTEVYLNQLVLITLIFMTIYLIILKIYSCIKNILHDIESMRVRHYHPFCKDTDNYLAEYKISTRSL